MTPDDIKKRVVEDLGIGALSADEQDNIIAAFGEVALKAATIAIIEKLPPAQRDEFARLAQGGDAEALQAFLTKELPEHEAVAQAAVQEEVKRFREAQGA